MKLCPNLIKPIKVSIILLAKTSRLAHVKNVNDYITAGPNLGDGFMIEWNLEPIIFALYWF